MDIAKGGRAPVDVHNGHAKCCQVPGKPLKTEIHHTGGGWQETICGIGQGTGSLAPSLIARRWLLSERRDDVASIDLQGVLFSTTHQIDIQLGDAGFLKLPQPVQVR